MRKYPECEYRYSPVCGYYELCDFGNENIPPHKKNIQTCGANVCPLNKYPESEKITLREAYERDMRKIDRLNL